MHWRKALQPKSTHLTASPLLPTDLKRSATLLLGCFFALAIALAFRNNQDLLLHGYDGTNWIVNLELQYRFRTPFTSLAMDPVQGMFDTMFPAYREYLLPYLLATPVLGESVSKVWIYSVYSALLNISIYCLGRTVGMSRAVALTGAFATSLLVFPVFGKSYGAIYPLLALNPHVAQSIAATVLILAALWSIDRRRPVYGLVVWSTALLLVFVSILGTPSLVVVMVPAITVYGLGAICMARNWWTAFARATAAMALPVMPAALGAAHYILGMSVYTAFMFFPEYFPQLRPGFFYASIAYHQDGFTGATIIGLGLLGAVLAARGEKHPLKAFAIVHLAATLLFQVTAAGVVLFGGDYQGPSPLYFEVYLWPISVLFSAYTVYSTLGAGLRVMGSIDVGALALPALPVALLVLIAGMASMTASGTPAGAPASLRQTPITNFLAREIGLSPGRPFNGSVATFTAGGPSTDWFRQTTFDHLAWRLTGNDHRGPGLWTFGIPTLFQYNTYLTPPYFLILARLLAEPDTRQIRTVALLTKPNEPILALLGARYLITDQPSLLGTTRVSLPVDSTTSLYAVELRQSANRGDFSPTEVTEARTAVAILALLHDPSFDGRRHVALEERPSEMLVPTKKSQMQIVKGGLRLRATTEGRSLLVLPVQYSNCWEIEGRSGAQLIRANLLQLGVLFSGGIDLTLRLRFGPILSGGCRWKDAVDARRLRVSEAGRR